MTPEQWDEKLAPFYDIALVGVSVFVLFAAVVIFLLAIVAVKVMVARG